MAELDPGDSSNEIKTEAALVAAPVRTGAVALVLLVTGVLVAAAVYSHLSIASNLTDYTGLLAPLDRLFDFLLVALVGAISFCTGRAISRLIGVDYSNLAEEASFCIGIGTGVIGLAVLGLGLIGLLSLAPVAVVLILLIAWSRMEFRTMINLVRRVWQKTKGDKQAQIIAGLFLLLGVLLAIRTATPPHAVDESIYHLAAPKSFIEQGRVYPLLDSFSGNMPFLVHMIYAAFLLVKADIAAKLYSTFLALMCSVALYGFCTRFLSRRIAILSMFGFFAAGLIVEVAVTARNDVTLAAMLFLAAYAMIVYLDTRKRAWLWVSAITSGLSLGLKYSAFFGVGLIGLMLLIETLATKRESLSKVIRGAALYAGITIVVASPWYIKNLIWFSNPVYPYLTGEVAEIKDGGARYFNSDDQHQVDKYVSLARAVMPDQTSAIEQYLAEKAQERVERHPLRFWDHFLHPDRYVLGAYAEAYHDPNYLFLVFPILFLLRRQRWLAWLAVLSVGFFIGAAATSWIARYFLPVYPALTILSTAALVEVADRLRRYSPRVFMLPGLLVAVTAGSALFVSTVQAYQAGTLSFLAGRLSRGEFMSPAFYYPPLDFINRNLPGDARVMMIGAQMGYDLQRPYLAEAGWDSVEWRRTLIRNPSLESVHQDLKRRGVTHILFSRSLFEFVAAMGREGSGPSGVQFNQHGSSGLPDYQVQLENWTTVELYRAGFLETVFTHEEYELLRLK